jgi:hypothetical protein
LLPIFPGWLAARPQPSNQIVTNPVFGPFTVSSLHERNGFVTNFPGSEPRRTFFAAAAYLNRIRVNDRGGRSDFALAVYGMSVPEEKTVVNEHQPRENGFVSLTSAF